MELTSVLSTMKGAARTAAARLKLLRPDVERYASRKDFLTNADLESEREILKILTDAHPRIPSFSEEKGGTPLTKGYVWVIDPIDGTINYFNGDSHWSISIALVWNGKTVAAVIYLPDKDQLFSATHETNTILEHNGACSFPRVHAEAMLQNAQFWIGWGKEERGGADHERVYEVLKRLDRCSLYPQIRNSATADLMAVAIGQSGGFVFLKPEPFDIAAAGLILEHAGGMVTDLEGYPWRPFGSSLVGSNGRLHADLLKVIAGV